RDRTARPSYRPAFAGGPHLPEHPLIAAGRREVARHRPTLRGPDSPRDLVGNIEGRANDRAELLGGIRTDPTRIERIRRAGSLQRLADLPVDPVTGKQRA